MEGVGARLGRSSTRYGPATVFTGPVRKWKKKWIHVTPPNTSAASNNKHHHQSYGNSSSNGNNNNASASHLFLYKWTPIRQNHNTSANNNNSNGDANEDSGAAEVDEEPPRLELDQIAVLEEQHNEEAEVQADEDKPKSVETESDSLAAADDESSLKNEKPDINDMPMEENQVSENIDVEREDLNKSDVGLSLNLNEGDGDGDGGEESEEAKDETNDD